MRKRKILKILMSVVLVFCIVFGGMSAIENQVSAGNYSNGGCVRWVKDRAYTKLGISLGAIGNAKDVFGNLKGKYQTGTEPKANSIACWAYSKYAVIDGVQYGHVAYVEAVNGDQVTISQGGWYQPTTYEGNTYVNCSTKTKSAIPTCDGCSQFLGYVYLEKTDPVPVANPSITVVEDVGSMNPAVQGQISAARTGTNYGCYAAIDNPNGSTIGEIGIILYDANGNELGKKTETYLQSANRQKTGYIYYTINEELGVTLTPGATYKYKMYAYVGDQRIETSLASFTIPGPTPGTSGNPSIRIIDDVGSMNPAVQETIAQARKGKNYGCYAEIDNPNGSTIGEIGIVLYDANGNELGRKTETYLQSANRQKTGYIYYTINEELGVTLQPGTIYKYKMYAYVGEQRLETDLAAFLTNGPVATPTPEINPTISVVEDVGNMNPTVQARISAARTNTNYACYASIDNPNGSTIGEIGIVLYDAAGNEIGKKTETYLESANTQTTGYIYYDINQELGVTLTPGTTYKYKMYAYVGDQRLETSLVTFTTSEPVSTTAPISTQIPTPSPQKTGTPSTANPIEKTPTPSSALVKEGDVNGDGIVDLQDVQIALQAYLEIASLSDEQKQAADIVSDGVIDLQDVQKILQVYLEI